MVRRKKKIQQRIKSFLLKEKNILFLQVHTQRTYLTSL